MKIYVGNLPYGMTESDLRDAFTQYGEIASITLVTDKYTGESKGFGFVEMNTQSQAEEAIKKLDGSALKGRNIRVNQARPPKKDARPRNFGRY